jgi:hypothetical protein
MGVNRNYPSLRQVFKFEGDVSKEVRIDTYLSALIIGKNNTGEEIKMTTSADNRCYYDLRILFRTEL